jgi:nitrogen fixation/metabolism regulation signal transduction histidine kinase
MNLLSDLRIGRRLGLAFAVSIAFSLLLAACARTALIRINDELETTVEDRLVNVQQLEQIKDNVNLTAQAVRNVLLVPDAAKAMALLITRSVVDPIQQAVNAAETVAAGDLRLNLDTRRRDEAGHS